MTILSISQIEQLVRQQIREDFEKKNPRAKSSWTNDQYGYGDDKIRAEYSSYASAWFDGWQSRVGAAQLHRAHSQLGEAHEKRVQLRKMLKMAQQIAEVNPAPHVLATIAQIEMELLYTKLQLNATY